MRLVQVRTRGELSALLGHLELRARPSPSDEVKVRRVLADVRRRGDAALLRCVRRFDGFRARQAGELRIPRASIEKATAAAGPAFLRACRAACTHLEAFQRRLRPSSWKRQLRPGVTLGLMVRPIRRVGLYVPGGAAPLVSTVLMSAVPARVAGVKEIALATPNRGQGLDPRLLAAAHVCGVDEIWQMGGAQAIAAFAFGTRSVPKVDKIAGPGSRWVNLAKRLVYGQVGIDSLAGPSESMIVADDSAPPAFVAADLLSQAEHSGHETAVLLTPSFKLARRTLGELGERLKALPPKNRARARKSLKRHGLVAVVPDLDMAFEIANARGPEHLQLMVRDAKSWLLRVRAAGAIFTGAFTPVALGDFIAGPSHVLPTHTSARFSSGLSVEDFVTKSSLIRYRREALRREAAFALELARAEGLEAHARSLMIRCPHDGL